ncbi:ADP-ribosylglycohydrolase family protein [Thermopolyspora sp. NPDC052614]|uniref:ADP-ribosylglycohydrolase family protein n=1 Tax=Thermopolyspora sp. NPDC052614 TaxID=3155682 RepID=UPI003438C936
MTDQSSEDVRGRGFHPPDGYLRLRNGIVAFACGDALGVPWEGRVSAEIDAARLEELPRRWGWPRGATSDDTEQLVLLAENLIATGGAGDPYAFLARLAAVRNTMRGIGPTTRRAIERFTTTGAPRTHEGSSNGAVMRVLPIGWATRPADAERRRALVGKLTMTTHGAPAAVAGACAVAAMGSYALETRRVERLTALALAEIERFDLGAAALPVRLAAEGAWSPGPQGVTLDVLDTVAAVLHVLHTMRDTADPTEAMRRAVLLGGDTDTVAAIVGGILGGLHATLTIPWSIDVEIPASLDELATGLWEIRNRF